LDFIKRWDFHFCGDHVSLKVEVTELQSFNQKHKQNKICMVFFRIYYVGNFIVSLDHIPGIFVLTETMFLMEFNIAGFMNYYGWKGCQHNKKIPRRRVIRHDNEL